MPKYWTEKLDIEQWRIAHGGKERTYNGQIIDNLVCPVSYCVRVCGFTFKFSCIEEIQEYIEYFSEKTHDSTRVKETYLFDHYDAQTKFTRLPMQLKSNQKRPKVLKALRRALDEFS